jgi:hypothetical protein
MSDDSKRLSTELNICQHGTNMGKYCQQCAGVSNVVEMPKASKNSSTKPDLSLIPYVALVAEARAFEVGEKKYGRYNYCKGHKSSQLIAAAQRHLLAWFQGEENDPVDGQPHLGSVRACMAMLLRQQELGTLIDDRYKEDKP